MTATNNAINTIIASFGESLDFERMLVVWSSLLKSMSPVGLCDREFSTLIPLDSNVKNLDLNKYSKNYLNHLCNTNEILGSMLLTLHNINFYQELMKAIRDNINNGTFDEFHDKYIDKL